MFNHKKRFARRLASDRFNYRNSTKGIKKYTVVSPRAKRAYRQVEFKNLPNFVYTVVCDYQDKQAKQHVTI